MKTGKLIALLKQQGFKQGEEWMLIPDTYMYYKESKELEVVTDKGFIFHFSRNEFFCHYDLSGFYVDLATKADTLKVLLCALFGKYYVSPDRESLRTEVNDIVRKHFSAIV